ITRIAPACLVVAVAGDKHAEKSVRVVVIADPGRLAEIVFEARLHTPENLRLNLTQLHLYAQFVPPHLLQFNGDVLMDFPAAAGRGVEKIFKTGKAFPAG